MQNAATVLDAQAASNRGMVAGEPGELKGSRRVREGGVGKGPQGTSPAPYLGRHVSDGAGAAGGVPRARRQAGEGDVGQTAV